MIGQQSPHDDSAVAVGDRDQFQVTSTRSCVEELDAAERHSQGSAGEGFVILQMQKELSQLIFRDLLGRALTEVGQLADASEVAFMSPL